MSDEIRTIDSMRGELKIVQFLSQNGPALQLSQGLGTAVNFDTPGFIQLSPGDVAVLVPELVKWLKSECERRANFLREQIKKDQSLADTIFDEAQRCESFIASFEVPQFCANLLLKTTYQPKQ